MLNLFIAAIVSSMFSIIAYEVVALYKERDYRE